MKNLYYAIGGALLSAIAFLLFKNKRLSKQSERLKIRRHKELAAQAEKDLADAKKRLEANHAAVAEAQKSYAKRHGGLYTYKGQPIGLTEREVRRIRKETTEAESAGGRL